MKKNLDQPKVVVIGGGHGLNTLLSGLKKRTPHITAVVTVADDGGGSGMLREDLHMPPPGDIRNCLQALANVEPLMHDLLSYRFAEGSLKGQSFGNLFLAALNGISGSFDEAVQHMSDVLAITGRVLPVTTADVKLEALFENGTAVVGESKIMDFKKEQDCRITQVRLLPERSAALPATLHAIEQADYIILGPGSLYTSIIPNLLVDGVVPAIVKAKALKLYVLNIMTQEGETEGYSAADHVEALLKHGAPGMFDICLANSGHVRPELRERYLGEGASPIAVDAARIRRMGIHLISRPLSSKTSHYAHHSSQRLAEALMELYGTWRTEHRIEAVKL
jgi:conserved hypothetical protein, cofD-related